MSEVPLYRGTGPRSLNTDEFIPHERRIPFAAPRCAPAHRPSTPQSRATAQPTARARSRTTLTPAAPWTPLTSRVEEGRVFEKTKGIFRGFTSPESGRDHSNSKVFARSVFSTVNAAT